MKRTENELDSRQVLSVIEKYSEALELLDSYDHQNMQRPSGSQANYILTYEECKNVIASMKFGNESELFGKEKMIHLPGASEIFINLLQDRRFIRHWRKRQRIYCIL